MRHVPECSVMVEEYLRKVTDAELHVVIPPDGLQTD